MLKKVNYEAHTDSYWVNLKPAELELIAALLYKVRLGAGNTYKEAAFSVSEGVADACGDDFMDDASNNVDPYFTVEDYDGNVSATIDSVYGTIEVRGGELLESAGTALAITTP